MLRVVLHGLKTDADTEGLTVLIHDSTSVGWLAARCQVQRLEEHDAVILSVEAERLAPLLRHAVQLGVRTADMLVGRTSE